MSAEHFVWRPREAVGAAVAEVATGAELATGAGLATGAALATGAECLLALPIPKARRSSRPVNGEIVDGEVDLQRTRRKDAREPEDALRRQRGGHCELRRQNEDGRQIEILLAQTVKRLGRTEPPVTRACRAGVVIPCSTE